MVLSSEKNLYEILEISSSAGALTIKTAYRRLARKYHPDLNGGDEICIIKFKEITEAYEILSNEEKKKNYDMMLGLYHEKSKTKFNEANKAYKATKKNEKQSEERFSTLFSDILEGFKTTASNPKNKTFKQKQSYPEAGSDVYTDITISIKESIQGTNRTVNILHTEICPNCEGRTFLNGSKCPLCKGLGEQSIHKKINVKIPANVKHGSKIRIANEGNRGYNGGKNGDLYLNIIIENKTDGIFKYEGLNAHCTVAIAPFEALLGADIDIQSPNGKVTMKITPNTNSGQKFRLAGEGLERENKKGDLIVTVNIELPKSPSKEELELYKKLRDITKNSVRENK